MSSCQTNVARAAHFKAIDGLRQGSLNSSPCSITSLELIRFLKNTSGLNSFIALLVRRQGNLTTSNLGAGTLGLNWTSLASGAGKGHLNNMWTMRWLAQLPRGTDLALRTSDLLVLPIDLELGLVVTFIGGGLRRPIRAQLTDQFYGEIFTTAVKQFGGGIAHIHQVITG